MDKGKVQESLATLYLRLNGYFTSGFIVHSRTIGENQTDIDVLGVRFPKHCQPERGVESAPELECTAPEIDIVIGEVKSHGQALQFNPGLRNSDEALSSVLRWVGAFEEQEIAGLVTQLRTALQPTNPAKPAVPTVPGPRSTRIRGLLFAPETNNRHHNGSWFLPGPPMFRYLWDCLHPSIPPDQCTTKYDFGLWGNELEPIVRYVKASNCPSTFKEFLEGLEAQAQAETEAGEIPPPNHW